MNMQKSEPWPRVVSEGAGDPAPCQQRVWESANRINWLGFSSPAESAKRRPHQALRPQSRLSTQEARP